jgi:Protein of unknown function (DUF2975)
MMTFFSRGDFVATRVALVTAAALYPLLVLVPRLVGWATGKPAYYLGHTDAPGPVLDETTASGVVGRYSDEVLWTIADPTVGQRLALLLPPLFATAMLAAGCVFLWRLVAAAQRGEPFTPVAVRQLQAVGLLVVAYGLVRPFLDPLVELLLFAPGGVPSVAFTLDFSLLLPIVAGTLVMVVAECFQIGTRMREDVDGLV